MKRFVLRTMMFLVPVVVYYGMPFAFMCLVGEVYTNWDEVIELQAMDREKLLLGLMYNEKSYRYYKYRTILAVQPKVLALGSSRVLQFRREMFKKSFYNGGYAIVSIKDFKTILSLIPERSLPRVLIVGLDQWMFNKNWDDIGRNQLMLSAKSYTTSGRLRTEQLLTMSRSFWGDVLGNEELVDIVGCNPERSSYRAVGLNALVNKAGFRNDGSKAYGIQIKRLLENSAKARDFKFEDTFNRISSGSRRFQYAQSFNPEALRQLDLFLSYVRSKKIHVVAFIPPYANEVYRKMVNSGHYAYLDELEEPLRQIAKKHGVSFFSFPTVGDLGFSDKYTIDGFHGSERVYLSILMKMAAEDKTLRGMVKSRDALNRDLLNAKNRYELY